MRPWKCCSPMPRSREPRAWAAVARTSGSGSTRAFCSSGMSSGTYGAMSCKPRLNVSGPAASRTHRVARTEQPCLCKDAYRDPKPSRVFAGGL